MFYETSTITLGVANLGVAGVLAWATISYAKAARRQAAATEDQANVVRPRPYVYLKIEEAWDALVLTNSGNRVAHDVQLTVVRDFVTQGDDPAPFLRGSRLVGTPSPGIPPGGHVREARGNRFVRSADRADQVEFRLTYRDSAGVEYGEQVTYSLGEVGWVAGSPPSGIGAAERDEWTRHSAVVDAITAVASAISAASRNLA